MIIWSCKINTFFILYKGLRKKSAIPLQNLLFIRLYLISFYYKDYRNNGKNKPATLPGVEFLRRFCMHILPKGFVKIRYYGILSSRYAKRTILLRANKTDRPKEKESVQERLKRLTDFDIYQCPFCKTGKMHRMEELPKIRSPVKFLRS